MKSFSELGLDEKLIKSLNEQGYNAATPIQTKAIPPILLGRDVMAAAQTGTGKTASFTLPILQRLIHYANNSMSPAKHPVRCLILTPTRELAAQVHDSVSTYGKYIGLRSTVLFGGMPIDQQLTQLRLGIEIVVATPGRLLDIEKNKAIHFSLLEFLILDEADRMFDMGFLPDITKIIGLLPKKRQTLLFSATYSDEIAKVASKWLTSPIRVDASPPNSLTKTVNHTFFEISSSLKIKSILTFLMDSPKSQSLIFCNTKLGADRLARDLITANIQAAVIHGDRAQADRLATLDKFKNGEVLVLVATDIAARGLDIENMPLVINFDVPSNPEDYVHRVGRTGRAGSRGEAVTFVTDPDDQNLHAIEKFAKLKVELKAFNRGLDNTGDAVKNDSFNSDSYISRRKSLPPNNISSLFSEPYKEKKLQSHKRASSRSLRLVPKKEIPALFLPPIEKRKEE